MARRRNMLPHVLGRVEALPCISLPDGFEASRIKSARLPAQRIAIPPTAKLEIPELRLIV
jgi:hypothetical protein